MSLFASVLGKLPIMAKIDASQPIDDGVNDSGLNPENSSFSAAFFNKLNPVLSSQIKNEGKAAYAANPSRPVCPYGPDDGDNLAAWWLDGWQAAYEEAHPEQDHSDNGLDKEPEHEGPDE